MAIPIRWRPRMPQAKIRRLYELDAHGLVDEVLLEDVGIGLYLRCQSILRVSEKPLECPRCGHLFATGWRWDRRHDAMTIRCPDCGEWETTGRAYRESFQNDGLAAGNCLPAFREYVARYPAARTARERMVWIDRLIHQFHSCRSGEEVRSWCSAGSPPTPRCLEESLASGGRESAWNSFLS